ncbi:MAG: Rpn family recombination-promoting nuclease/putative transposase, partial [Syntrophomonadaceae bacterium]|nr:Rpn family recombination-promoting nuclease/putative transposase [Syntrophomonadaceae bacterium]
MSEMTPVNNPHDAYFKATFGRIEFAKDFLKNFLPKDLKDLVKIESLTPEPTSYL